MLEITRVQKRELLEHFLLELQSLIYSTGSDICATYKEMHGEVHDTQVMHVGDRNTS